MENKLKQLLTYLADNIVVATDALKAEGYDINTEKDFTSTLFTIEYLYILGNRVAVDETIIIPDKYQAAYDYLLPRISALCLHIIDKTPMYEKMKFLLYYWKLLVIICKYDDLLEDNQKTKIYKIIEDAILK